MDWLTTKTDSQAGRAVGGPTFGAGLALPTIADRAEVSRQCHPLVRTLALIRAAIDPASEPGWSQLLSGPEVVRPFSSATASRARNGPTWSPSWAGWRNWLSCLTVYRVRRPVRLRVI